ncbi:hypothetical protein M9Y10_020804 [Tritrichomonas musculus]|uniref:Protein kinase domain-containing protein n=1 Tax=Tritrichomonas musculus TaxID=1915356 RepID=A0ABR2HFK6_9EUKA
MIIESNELESLFFNTTDFRLQDKSLGEGVFGKVYIGRQIKDNQRYAVKVLKGEGIFDGHEQMLLMRESLILHKLRHPCIVEFKGLNFQSFKDPTLLSPSIITEYLSHGSLKKILDDEKKARADINWTLTKKYINLLGISRAMKYLHSHNVIHRDLKPENILTDDNYYPRVCDFGLSRFFSKSISNGCKLTMTGQIGTPLYMAPELFEDEGHYGPAVDVYAFSMVLFEIVTGEVPFKELSGISPFSLGIKVMSGYRPKIPGNVPVKIAGLMRRCWSHKAEERPTFSEIFDELSSDLTMLGGSVDEDEIQDYIEMLHDKEKEKSKDLDSSNNKLHEELYKLDKKCHQLRREFREKERSYQKEIQNLKKKVQLSQMSQDFFSRGVARLFGNQKERNNIEGLAYLKQSSEAGNSASSFICGLLHENGEFAEKSFEKSVFYYQRSSSQGNTYGLTRLGACYYNGYGVEPNYSKAIDFYKKGTEQGNSYSMNGIGLCYKEGRGVDQNYAKSLNYFEKAAKLGNSNAINWIGVFYEQGLGVRQNYLKAFECYEKAAKLGNSFALRNLGCTYEVGRGVEQNYSKAFEYFEKAAKLGNPSAINWVGAFYEQGHGVKKNYSKAFEYYEKAAKLGNSKAIDSLGCLYYNGWGVKQSYSKALECFQNSAVLGNSDGLFHVGLCYEEGRGAKKDISKAVDYYSKAAKLGCDEAKLSLKRVLNINVKT